ncbi:hypothetical protein DLJ46_31905 [Micromonospora globispora]|uniref:Uncharacterized protein n=1 Tax=Micromonospora globispora TaxID=1450148 RepID=A0A317JRH7_9ACTN|nr:hypothetical protein DLJ46_31905 [Micromonospora globispora]RQX01158.1 hypothetical protein DKL51_05945 [Micromonospora globispora]
MATFDEWLDAYDIVYQALPGTADASCPNCGHKTLRLVFVGPPGRDVGYAAFWCDTCLEGIHISRAPIPAGVVARSLASPPEERLRGIPSYRVVM